MATLHHNLENTKLRLKAEYGWDDDFINSAINEYDRFLQLHKRYPKGKLVPGNIVDKIWHDHILHTRNYFNFCKMEFGDYLHHNPRNLLSSEMDDINPTIELYTKEFGHRPPSKFWFGDVRIESNKQNQSEQPFVVGFGFGKNQGSYTPECCRCD